MSKTAQVDFNKKWRAKEYLQAFYATNTVCTSEKLSLQYLVDFLKKENKVFDLALDVGSGPTIHQIVPLIPYVKELHVSDFMQDNLEEIRAFLSDESSAHNWDVYIQYVLDLEGKGEMIEQRKKTMKKIITQFLPIDIRKKHPLNTKKTYPLVTSFYCADSITNDKKLWECYVKNIFTLVKPGGIILLEALRNSDGYQVAKNHFPSAHINEHDFAILFANSKEFDKKSIDK